MLKVKYNHIPNLIRRFRELDKASFKVGYWDSQGKHNSGLTYPTLIAIHEWGSKTANIPSRPVLTDTFSIWSPLDENLLLKKQLKLYFSNIKSKTPVISAKMLVDRISGEYIELVRNNFGDEGKLTPNAPFTQYLKARGGADPSKPLVWTGDLRNNLSYSINGQQIVTP